MMKLINVTGICVFITITQITAQSFSLIEPDEIGSNFVGTHQDASQIGYADGFGPGVQFYLKYNLNPNFFITLGTGLTTVTDKFFAEENFKNVLFPQIEFNAGHHLFVYKRFTPFLYSGFQLFRSIIKDDPASNEDPPVDMCLIFGSGFRFILKESRMAFYMTGDYRNVFTSKDKVRPQYWVGRAGFTLSMNESFFEPDKKKQPIQNRNQDNELLAMGIKEQSNNITSVQFGQKQPKSNLNTGRKNYTKLNSKQLEQLSDEIKQMVSHVQSLENKNKIIERRLAEIQNSKNNFKSIPSEIEYKSLSIHELYTSALMKIEKENYISAIRDLNGILGRNGESNQMKSKCKYWIGSCYICLGDYQSALQYFVDVLKINKDVNAAGADQLRKIPIINKNRDLTYNN